MWSQTWSVQYSKEYHQVSFAFQALPFVETRACARHSLSNPMTSLHRLEWSRDPLSQSPRIYLQIIKITISRSQVLDTHEFCNIISYGFSWLFWSVPRCSGFPAIVHATKKETKQKSLISYISFPSYLVFSVFPTHPSHFLSEKPWTRGWLLVFTSDGFGVGILSGVVRALMTLWKSKIGVVSTTESEWKESERFHLLPTPLMTPSFTI